MWRSVDLVWTEVSEERISSIFRVKKSASEEPAWAGGCRFLYLEDGGDTFLRNVGSRKIYYFTFIDKCSQNTKSAKYLSTTNIACHTITT
jgi:peptidoglycan/xylan/chitin deacetylase (PgdA/CDA1 family)